MENYMVHYEDWTFTGQVIDNKEPISTYDLCEKYGLRYEFQIVYSGEKPLPEPDEAGQPVLPHYMWVGSVSIHKFEVRVLDDSGRLLRRGEVPAFLRAVLRKKKHNTVVETLRKLYRCDETNRERIVRIGLAFKAKGVLLPNDAVFVLQRFDAYELSLPPGYLKLTLKKKVHKQAVLSLSPAARRRLMAALTFPQQRTIRDWLEAEG